MRECKWRQHHLHFLHFLVACDSVSGTSLGKTNSLYMRPCYKKPTWQRRDPVATFNIPTAATNISQPMKNTDYTLFFLSWAISAPVVLSFTVEMHFENIWHSARSSTFLRRQSHGCNLDKRLLLLFSLNLRRRRSTRCWPTSRSSHVKWSP